MRLRRILRIGPQTKIGKGNISHKIMYATTLTLYWLGKYNGSSRVSVNISWTLNYVLSSPEYRNFYFSF